MFKGKRQITRKNDMRFLIHMHGLSQEVVRFLEDTIHGEARCAESCGDLLMGSFAGECQSEDVSITCGILALPEPLTQLRVAL
ncbi:MAG: hypothetical protein IVW57_01205 [Ktedonobacterales bacterium]|nr:hypothetical protein [Ktedonobacterales bacterium]